MWSQQPRLNPYVYIILLYYCDKRAGKAKLVHCIVEFTLVSDNVRICIQSSIKGSTSKEVFGFYRLIFRDSALFFLISKLINTDANLETKLK